MGRDALKVAIRTLFRFPVHSLITLSGLAAGLACCLLISLYVVDELSYDRYNLDADNICRIATEHRVSDRRVGDALTPGPLASAVAGEFPEVLAAVRFWKDPGRESVVVGTGLRSGSEKRFYFCDPSVFRVFTFPLVRGEPDRCLREPFTVVLSESAARRYFGTIDPVGRRLSVNLGEPREYRVTGVMQDIPRSSHLRADFLASLSSLEEMQGHLFIDWQRADFYTYILLSREYSPDALSGSLRDLIGKYMGPESYNRVGFFLQPLTSIHLRSHLESEAEPNGDIATVTAFSAIALFVLLIACINFMNLATARSSARAREVAVRKILGARRGGLILQFMGESVFTALLALLFACSLVEMALPAFN
ncbi:MAG TPA: ABC transporter permease, partial [Armatimonadota bacterium]|nr:ABC transporter permease [Armatimonadota bacterium]